MGVNYQAVLWNRQKRIYDLTLWALIFLYLISFVVFNSIYHPQVVPPTLIARATGSLALIMLHIILVIGPLSRLDKRFLPLLYNRRHLGVSMFILALAHGVFGILQFHAFGDINPILSVFVSNTHYGEIMRFPFQSLGFIALIILFLMAASSHDFWLKNLSPKVWKSLHMLVYLAYGLVIMHVMLGVVQIEDSPLLMGALGVGMVMVIGLHLVAGYQTFKRDRSLQLLLEAGYAKACQVSDIREKRAVLAHLQGKSIAIFKYDGKLSAVDNACKHQNGPLSEGKIVNGCITCPWHGYQYQPENGTSPPPFDEKVATYQLKLVGDEVWVNTEGLAPGSRVEPCQINRDEHGS